ncbi:MAG: hypothetical protein AB4368_00310 [Xenococcaceae cyanobacterium]
MEIDRYEVRQIGRDNLDLEIDTAKAAVKLFQLLLKKLRELLDKNPGLEQNQSPLTIKVNGKKYYQAQLDRPPTLDLLTPQQIKYLEQAVSSSPQKQLEHKPDLEITAKDIVLYKAEKGIVKTNQISTEAKQEPQIIDAEIVNESPQTPALLPQRGEREVAQTAEALVNHLGEDYGSHKTFEGKSYLITQTLPQPGKSPELTIFAKDGRGEIFKLNDNELVSNLQATDIDKFAQIERELAQDLSKQQKSEQDREPEL